MSTNLKALATIAKAIFVGLTALVILAIVFLFTIEPIVDAIFPPRELMGMGMSGSSNTRKVTSSFFCLYLLSVCVAGFISGVLLNRWKEASGSHTWHSLISGFVVGGSGPAFVLFIISRKPLNVDLVMIIMVVGIPGALGALIGYYIANRNIASKFLSDNEDE